MIRQKKIASVLAGVSFVALAAAVAPAHAAGSPFVGNTFVGGFSVSADTNPLNRDYIEFFNVTVEGDVVVDEDLGGGAGVQNDIGFGIVGGTIEGDFSNNAIITANVTVTGTTDDAGTSLAGVTIFGEVEGQVINNGTIGASANANSIEDADALAFGLATVGDDDSNIDNNNLIDVDANAIAYDTTLSIAGGVGQVGIGSGTTSATFSNDGDVKVQAYAKSKAGDEDGDPTDSAFALGLGAGQLVIGDIASASITNSGDGLLQVYATASATGGYASQESFVAGVGAAQVALGLSEADAMFTNDGVVDLTVNGKASADLDTYEANVLALGAGVVQVAGTIYEEATTTVVNRGTIDVTVNADAQGLYAETEAFGLGSLQVAASVFGEATTNFENTSPLSVDVEVNSTTLGDYADADSYVIGVAQVALSALNTADTNVVNSGRIQSDANSSATGTFEAYAEADSGAVKQLSVSLLDSANASLINYSEIDANAHAVASAYTSARADAAASGVVQLGLGLGPVNTILTNSGMISADAMANAYATVSAIAEAEALGAGQFGLAGQNVNITATNSGDITAVANAMASGTLLEPLAYGTAIAEATGVKQGSFEIDLSEILPIPLDLTLPTSLLGDVTATLTNTDMISAQANATVSASQDAYASAVAIGVDQELVSIIGGDVSGSVFNDNNIFATAQAFAYATANDGNYEADATAAATGVDQYGNALAGGDVALMLDNTGIIGANAMATAIASGYDNADAEAEAFGAEQDAIALLGGSAFVSTFNEGTITAYAEANATASDTWSDAEAEALAAGVEQGALSLMGPASASFTNYSTDAAVGAIARANAISNDDDAEAYATAAGVVQEVTGGMAYLSDANLTNNGTIGAAAYADAQATAPGEDAFAEAEAFGVLQEVTSFTGAAMASATNAGSISGFASAFASAYDSATGSASATGILQLVGSFNDDATAIVTNTGDVMGHADAKAYSAYGSASASADVVGIHQDVYSELNGDASATVTNSPDGMISALADATASGYTSASASASATGVLQRVSAGRDNASATVTNDGTIAATANALAQGVDGWIATSANAYAGASGVDQELEAYDNATATVTNTSSETISAIADAKAYGYTSAEAYASATGVEQEAYAGENALVQTTNSGMISASANALASATSAAGAGAYAVGVGQYVAGEESSTAVLNNSGTIRAVSNATTYGTSDIANAYAWGHYAGASETGSAYDFETLTLNVTNSEGGLISAMAEASATDTANALAAGAWYAGNGYLPDQGQGGLQGFISNAGTIIGEAIANGSTGYATAFGVVEVSSEFNETVLTNTGIIAAMATGPTAFATGVAIASYLQPQIVAQAAIVPADPIEGVAQINNDGGVIWGGARNDDADPFRRSTAINTTGFTTFDDNTYGAAPNPVVMNFTGGEAGSAGKDFVANESGVSSYVQTALSNYDSYGYIYGDIYMNDVDTINVSDGVTIFDGVINPDEENVGDLNILDGGKLVMVQNELDGPSAGFVDELTVQNGGTLVYELTPNTGAGDYPQIDANTATLDGKFVAIYQAGFYGDSMFYDDVISSGARTGLFDEGVEDNSILLVTEAVADGDNVDLNVTRTAFNAVDGLTKNQKAAGGGIEKVYDQLGPTIDTNFERMVANLFTLGDGDYQDFLDQLTGAEYANHLTSVLWSTRALNRIITDRMECTPDSAYQRAADNSSVRVDGNTVTPTADVISSTGCFRPGEVNLWMSGVGQWNELSGDRNAPGMDETQYGIYFGADYAFNEVLFAGIAGGYFDSQGDFDKWGGRSGASIDYDGLQLAAYGGYDNATYYLRGIVAYGNYDGDSHRMVELNGSPVDPSGSPSSDTWSFYGETGYRWGLMSAGQITPFLGLSLASADLDGFTEKDPQGTGAALKVHNSDASSVASVLGARFTADWAMGAGVFSPVLSVAWMHEFGDTAQQVHMSFAGAPKGANFNVVGSEVARDSAVVDAGAKFLVSESFDLGLFYNGQFNADYTSNAVTATLGYRF